jgi:hypothetical protein
MDMVSLWPVVAAGGVGTAGLVGAWWFSRRKSSAAASAGEDADEDRQGKASSRGGASRNGRGNRRPRSQHIEALDTLADWEPLATRVLTTAEREAYHVLRKALPDHMVLAQVPVARFIKVPTRNPYSEWLRRVGSLCADLVVCDMASQVVAVVEVRQPLSRENERAQRRHARMDRVLEGARVPVHVWLEGALPGPAVVREAILGSAINTSGRAGYQDLSVARRDAEAAAVVASMQAPAKPVTAGMLVDDRPVDFDPDDWGDDEALTPDGHRKEPPPSTWFDDLDSGPAPLDDVPSPVAKKPGR